MSRRWHATRLRGASSGDRLRPDEDRDRWYDDSFEPESPLARRYRRRRTAFAYLILVSLAGAMIASLVGRILPP